LIILPNSDATVTIQESTADGVADLGDDTSRGRSDSPNATLKMQRGFKLRRSTDISLLCRSNRLNPDMHLWRSKRLNPKLGD